MELSIYKPSFLTVSSGVIAAVAVAWPTGYHGAPDLVVAMESHC